MRLAWQLACVSVMLAGCTLLTDLGGYAGSAPPDAGADGAPVDSGTRSGDAGGPDAFGADAGADATAQDADAGANVVFADSFDDGAPLPRAWDLVSGAPEIVTAADAPSAPGALRAASIAASPAESFLSKTVEIPGASKVSCRFALNLTEFAGGDYVYSARLQAKHGPYVSLQLLSSEWHVYGQLGAQAFSGGASRKMEATWVDATLTVEKGGRVRVEVGGDVRELGVDGGATDGLTLSLGITSKPASNTYELLYDDVVCTAE